MCSHETMCRINDRALTSVEAAESMLASLPAEHPDRARLEERLEMARRKYVVTQRNLASTDPVSFTTTRQ